MNLKHSLGKKRPPIVVVMGHVDHGKSTLLDYIRKTNTTAKEVGGITQHIAAYVAHHKNEDGVVEELTFIDTPGHAAFWGMRERGAALADVAILVVAADDGVKPQTVEALRSIEKAGIPYIVAINKIDKDGTSPDKAKQSLAEQGVYVEGYGGNVPVAVISAKTGRGVNELLELVLLTAELEELVADPNTNARGLVIEAHKDPRKGVSATLVVHNGTLKKGDYIVIGNEITCARAIEDESGAIIVGAGPSNPAFVSGLNMVPNAGEHFVAFRNKSEAEKALSGVGSKNENANKSSPEVSKEISIPLLIKADTNGRCEAVLAEIKKCESDKVSVDIVGSGVGNITEGDIKKALGNSKPLIIGFGVSADKPALDLAERYEIKIESFDIIYKLTEWLKEHICKITPKEVVETVTGEAKILKTFSRTKDKQVVGGEVRSGKIERAKRVRILRRDAVLGEGKITNLQSARNDVAEIPEGQQFGTIIESKIIIAVGDMVQIVSAL
ncbi:MAG: translation initiation factor IF-2 [Parcubacteria group bacterium RIFCSPHIGHO2_01_FULL_45_26]|nr:MAG: translation initiation factor IF-2 [Parcubacteria group bacterium RIFCSPHIGHO2_01_FULL_45_26]